MTERIEPGAARGIAFAASGLGRDFSRSETGAAQAVRRLGSVQIDTISVVERAHHHILWSRVPGYRCEQLARLETEPRRIIEYWSHAAAYLPIEDYRFSLPRMERVREQGHDWFQADARTVARVRDRIRAEGPLRVKDFEGARKDSAGWWDWKPAKVALEYLFHAGELVSLGREGFQKRYDLAERALPSTLDLRMPDAREMAAHYVNTAVRALGVFTEADVAYGRKELLEEIPAEIAQRVESGSLVRMSAEGLGGKGAWYAGAEPLGAAAEVLGPPRAFLLSPFDPLVIDRRRTKRLFGVEFQIECYLPAGKRKFGYFALPVLYRDGRGEPSVRGLLDAKADRGNKTLILRRLALSTEGLRRPLALAPALAAELLRYARFNGCERCELQRFDSEHPSLETELRRRLAQ